MSTVKYPKAKVQLSGRDGNVFSIMGRVIAALEKAGASDDEIAEFTADAQSGNYDHAIQTCMKWVNVR